jgi:hypothetical protein
VSDCQAELDQQTEALPGALDCSALLFFFTGDEDDDGVSDLNDNAQEDFNPDQTDSDGDQQGDAVDPDGESVPASELDANFGGDFFDFEDENGPVPLIDGRDIAYLAAFRDTPADDADRRDRDADGWITVLDIRLVALDCTLPGCAVPQATLSVEATGSGSGTVTLDPPGGTYEAGTIVTLSATPDEGSIFVGFGGELEGPDTVLMDSATKEVTATFEILAVPAGESP